ncbi:MAG TPA: thioredoxin domain-containing protein [Candidatus Binatia bacterium]|nr:thioredoxin domain-containing protein [Candidatus Binatia bacterium]
MNPQHTNRLIDEVSPYLQQHAHNPVEWYPWGEEAFLRAKNENKPVLLSIGYSACHWCHVMERESFEDEKIAKLMNELFVNIKVDREERPDVDEIYMNAVQMLTGRGGWPMTVFLTPDGKPFYGGTYFPPEDRHGMPGFPRILVSVAQAYRERPQDVQNSVEQIHAALQRLSQSKPSKQAFAPDTIARASEEISRAYDSENGGLGQAPKFPHPGVYELFLRHYHRSRNPRYLEMVTHTLRKMAEGGIYDHLGGGFHRYSVDAKWLVPHFEKMLYDNAQLVRIYSQAYALTGTALFKTVVEETVEYLLREMLHLEAGFYSTQDADSEGEEGKFFVWSPEEVNRILGEETAEVFSRIYDVTEFGNFEGKNILHRVLTFEQAARLFKRDVKTIADLVSKAKKQLFQEREKRIKPFRDEKIITSWNGLMLSGLAEAIKIAPKPSYVEAATRTVQFIFAKLYRDAHLLHTYKDGIAKLPGYLDDYAFLGAGLLDLYEATFERASLERAIQLADSMIDEFSDSADGAFFSTGKSHEPLISRPKPAFDGSIPSGNALAAQLLLRLYHYTGREEYLRRGEAVMHSFQSGIESQPFGFAHMLCALDFYLEKPKEIVVLGKRDDAATAALIKEIHSAYLPNKTLQFVSPGESLEKMSSALQGKTQIDGRPTVYICQQFTCSAPVTDSRELKDLLQP